MFLIPFKKYSLQSQLNTDEFSTSLEKNILPIGLAYDPKNKGNGFEGRKLSNGFEIRRVQGGGMYSFSPRTTIKINKQNQGCEVQVRSHFKFFVNFFLLMLTAAIGAAIFYPIFKADVTTEVVEAKDFVVLLTPYIFTLLMFSFENTQVKTFLTEVVEKGKQEVSI